MSEGLTSQPARRGPRREEQRWPMVIAVLATGVLHEFLPPEFQVIPQSLIVYPLFLMVFLGVLIVGDPRRIDRERGGCGSPPR